MEDIAKRDIPKIKDSYRVAEQFIRRELQGIVQEEDIYKLVEQICSNSAITTDAKKQQDLIVAHLRMMFEVANTFYTSIRIV